MMSNPFAKLRRVPNLLRFTPPGFPCSIDVPFPGRLLPVCDKCKGNFKTREHCRIRECHTSLPWSDIFVCVSLDPSCTNEDNTLMPGPFLSRTVPPQPVCLPEETNPETTICGACKDKNYTRAYCRVSKKHRQVPWNTVFIVLSYDPSIQVLDVGDENPKKPSRSKRRKVGKTEDHDQTDATAESTPAPPVPVETQTIATAGEKHHAVTTEDRRFYDEIPQSRTFLVTASFSASSVQWLDFDANYSIKMWPGVRMGMETSPYRRNMNDDSNMLQMYGYMSSFGPSDMPPPISMFDGKNVHPRDYPLLRGPPDQFSANEALSDGRGYPMNMPIPPPEMFESYPLTSSRFRRGGDSSSAGGMPGLPSSSGDGPSSRGMPWDYGMSEYPSGRSSLQNQMSWQGLPGPGYFVGRQYPSPYGAPPGPANGDDEK